ARSTGWRSFSIFSISIRIWRKEEPFCRRFPRPFGMILANLLKNWQIVKRNEGLRSLRGNFVTGINSLEGILLRLTDGLVHQEREGFGEIFPSRLVLWRRGSWG